MFDSESQSYYEILDVKPDASQAEIRQAYLRTKAAYSKDSAALYSLFDERETRSVLDGIEQAYLVLSNPEKRKEYDRVHGFLRTTENLPSAQRPASAPANVFSFDSSGAKDDAAHHAAKAVFGEGAGSDMNAPAASAQSAMPSLLASPAAPAASTASRQGSAATSEDYSTPRTLASHGAAGPPVQDYVSSSFSANENRLGIIRRIDLVKDYQKDAQMEQMIADETVFRGDFFKKVRDYKGIAIDELSDFTKISKTYITCIEGEEFESLPAPAYLRGFIVQIAKALKLPHEKAATGYMAYYRSVIQK